MKRSYIFITLDGTRPIFLGTWEKFREWSKENRMEKYWFLMKEVK